MFKRFHDCYTTKQKQGTNGRKACLQCEGDITNLRRRTFCGPKCDHDFRMKTSSTYVRIKVFERDKGICGKCGIDTHSKRALGTGHKWQADHILAVVEGGGQCGIENYRTLCTACHKLVTKELAARRVQERKMDLALAASQ